MDRCKHYIYRTGIELKAFKIEFETPAMFINIGFSRLIRKIQKNYTVPNIR